MKEKEKITHEKTSKKSLGKYGLLKKNSSNLITSSDVIKNKKVTFSVNHKYSKKNTVVQMENNFKKHLIKKHIS